MPRLLVVDDERSIRVTFRDTLSKHGYEVDVAADAEEALRLLAQQTYDTVLLDIVLPRMNGITLLQQLKERDPDVPVVMITGDPHLQTATEALRLGAYDYLQKPINRRTLVHVVQRAVDRRRLIAEKKALEAQLALRLKESEAAFRQLIEHSSDIILGLDLEGHVLVVNRSLETVLGHPRHTWHHVEVLLQHCHPEDTAALQQALAQAAGSHPAGDLEVRLRRADGAWLWFSLVLYPLIREDGAIFGIGGILRDVTMRKRMEQEMRHAERLALVGQLASGPGARNRHPAQHHRRQRRAAAYGARQRRHPGHRPARHHRAGRPHHPPHRAPAHLGPQQGTAHAAAVPARAAATRPAPAGNAL
ncbi:MAG: hypothetical protein KatS3mg131_3634 [Candidatus Tectimicrobiota bacterium]|nr:MAG: hypothetical protein KatS3mg131_3634 [Candidatus Tectomicrobia bacterium]